MPDDIEQLLRRLVCGEVGTVTDILERAESDHTPSLLVAAALVSDRPAGYLARATHVASTTRDRQLLAIATAHLAHDEDLLDALVRDHLCDHPDHILVAWIASQHTSSGHPADEHQE